MNATRIKEVNEFLGRHVLEERCSLLLTFTSRDEERAHRSETATIGLPIAEAYQAHYLWHERFFPLRAKRLSPGLLGAEVILPLERASDYLARAKALGGNFGVQISSEAHFLDDGNVLVISSYRFDPRSEISELFQAALALLLTKTGIDMGGCPYGIGIWNTPFLRYKHNRKTVKDLQRFKMEVAPDSVFNPGKFFSPPPGICGQLFRPLPLKMGLGALNFMAPAHRWFDSRGSVDGKGDLIRETISSCSGCGSCVPVCPAYLYTKDERTTARGKLWLASKLGDGRLSPEEAQAFFLCMHCDACTDVCQSGLRLKPVWEELESRIEAEFGKDEDRIRKFVEGVEGSGIMEEMLHGEQQI